MAGNPFDNKGGSPTATKSKGFAVANGDGDPIPAARDPFAVPGGGASDYKFTDFLGELLLVRPTEYVEEMLTKIGTTDVVRVDVIRLDNENEEVEDLLIFQEALKRTFKKVLRGDNEFVLGRLEMGEAKNGKSAPYILSRATAEDGERAKTVMHSLGLL